MDKNKDNSHEEDEELRELVERALKDNIKERKSFKSRKELANRLGTILCEYLDSYILLGYDFSGKHLDIKAAKTPQQKEALNSFLMKYFATEIGTIKGVNPDTDDLL
tara:strand:- start:367 stop:687 length:321 start_codon:yes stop_codon:yes gene_type:complete